MSQHIKSTLKILQRSGRLTDAEKRNAIESIQLAQKELEFKNKSLAIEDSLDRVRTVALRMKQPADMLEVCKTISLQMKLLGVKDIRNIQTAIFYESRGSYMNYEYYSKHRKAIITETSYTNHKVHRAFAKKMLQGNGEFFISHIKGKKVKEWIAYQKTTNVFIDRFLEKTDSLNYYWHSLGPVALGISSYIPLNKEELGLFKRFLNVFELAYTRYFDIEQAQTQAREAKIEASLERVRARTMAMQKSDELREVSLVLFQQLKDLGEPAEQLTIGIIKEEENIVEVFATLQGIKLLQLFRHDIDERFVMYKMFKAWKAGQKTLVIDQQWEELKAYNQYRNKLVGSKMFPVNLKPGDRRLVYIAFFSKGTLALSSNEPRPKETLQLLERFASVLDLTYTRFNDLQKAEAQTREALIETSLERVRSKTMAMHNSNDVAETVATMFDEWVKLGIKTFRCGIGIMKMDHEMEVWTARPGVDGKVALAMGRINMSIHPLLEGAYTGWKNKLETFTYELKNDDIKKYFTAINNHVDYHVKYDLNNMPSKIYHQDFYFPEGTLFVFSLEELSAETRLVLQRFSAVLSQTYRRFLDLQLAEAQTREAKIEAALERVRSKAMAMHKSDDLNDAVKVVFEELHKLNPGMLRCGIGILSKEKRCADVYTTVSTENGHTLQVMGDEAMDIHPLLHNAYEAWLRNEDDYSHQMEGQEILDYYSALTKTNFHLPVSQQVLSERKGYKQFTYHANFQSGSLFAFGETAFSDEAKSLMKRFASVFNLTYQRFLDIQNAEAHAAEAEIQKRLVEMKHKEITENISYALRIQSAILPSPKFVKEHLQNSFVLYLPKDVVAGDFYWMMRIKDALLFAVCDCTGHGVSGAMVSVICHNALNNAVRECNLTQPSLILDKVVELVEENFRQSESEIRDGMDVSLCAYFPEQGKLQWSGANNPMWIVRKNELLEFKPDKQPIGRYENRQPFTNHEIELQIDDNIYLFSDGYHDQFGGEKGKKFSKNRLKNIFQSVSNKNMDEQHQELLNHHYQWKGMEEQVDDICLMGIKI